MTASTIDSLARELLAEAGVGPDPLIDIEALATHLGVQAIEKAPLVEDGRLEVGASGIRLLVRTGLTSSRRRFTIGHELGHLLLVDPRAKAVARRLRPPTSDVERFCDEVAAAILMPQVWVESRFAHRQQNLSTVRHLANRTGTSLSAAIARLVELLGWQKALLRWRLDRENWRFIAGSGVPPWLHGSIRSAPSTSREFNSIAAKTRRDYRAMISLLVFNQEIKVDSQVSVSGSSALVLVDLRGAQSDLVRAARAHRSRVASSTPDGGVRLLASGPIFP